MAADAGAGMGARVFLIIAVIAALGYACAGQQESGSRPTPTPSISAEVAK